MVEHAELQKANTHVYAELDLLAITVNQKLMNVTAGHVRTVDNVWMKIKPIDADAYQVCE